MRIGLNLLPALPGIGGVWVYDANLLRALAEYGTDHEFVVFITPAARPLVPDQPNFRAVEVSFRAQSRPLRVAVENSVLPLLIRRERLDCMHHLAGALPLFAQGPTVVTIHDLLAFARPSDLRPVKRVYLRLMQRRAARHATMLAPISRATADHLRRVFGVSEDRIQVVPAGVPSHFRRASAAQIAAFRRRYGVPDEFWLCVAAAYPHKNYDQLLSAVAELRRESPRAWPLVVRGELTAQLRARAATMGLDKRIIVLPRLADHEMPVLYSAASALVLASLFEGGGIPVMEAMACECPVVASDIPTTREFTAGAALTFDPLDRAALVSAMRRCETSPELRRDLATAGLEAASRLRPSAVAAACLSAYRRAATVYATRGGPARQHESPAAAGH